MSVVMQSKKTQTKNIVQKNNVFFLNLKKIKIILILWSAYSVIHIIYCIIQAVKHYMNYIYDS